MKRFTTACLLAIFVLLIRPVFADDDTPFKLDISLHGDYKEGIKSPACAFALNTTITNTSDEDQKITVWSCGNGDTWFTEGANIFLTGVMSCDKNTPLEITLKKHEKYKGVLHITILKGTPTGTVSFRLGFKPPRIDAPWTYKGYIQYPVIWSNTLKIKIEDWMQPLFILEPKEKIN